MKIECKLIRDGGTRADIDGVEYHFEPLPDGKHVAEVTHEAHIDRFLAIPDGYRVYHGEHDPKGKPAAVAASAGLSPAPAKKAREGSFLKGSDNHQPQYEIGSKIYALGDVVRKAFEASGLTEDDWNELPEDEREAKIDIALDDLADAAEAAAKAAASTPAADADAGAEGKGEGEGEAPAANPERDALVAAYKEKFGKAPHYRASVETIKAALAAE